MQVKKCRASIRDCVRLCEESEGERPIPPELFNEDGELDEEFIFCCRCTETDAPEVPLLLTYLHLHGCCCRESQMLLLLSHMPDGAGQAAMC